MSNKYTTLESTIRSLGAKSASQPMEKDMNDQVHAGSYTSKNFEVSKPAQKLFASLPKGTNPDTAEKSVALHDKLFDLHKKAKASGKTSKSDVETAEDLATKIMSLGKEMGIEDKLGHVNASVDFIKKNLEGDEKDKTSVTPDDAAKAFASPPKDYQSDVKSDSDIDNMAKFKISRDKRAQRKLKIIDDQFIPGVNKMDRIEDVSPSFLEALKQVQANAQDLEEKKLIGKQHKLDKNKNGRLDADDFKKLRGEEFKAEEIDEAKEKHNYTPEGVNCPVCGMKACPPKPTNEETVEEGKSSEPKPKLYADTMKAATKFNASNISKMMRDEKARKAAEAKKKTNEEVELDEGGMPASVIKHKQQLANMSDEEFAEKHGSKTEKQLRDMAARHGYGWDKATKTGSDHYVKRVAKGKKAEANEETELDEAQFLFIQKGMTRRRIRNNPVEIARARKQGWAINEDAVDEATSPLKALGDQQKKQVVQREVQQKKAMFAKKNAVDKQKFSKSMQNIKAGDEVEVDGEQIDELSNRVKSAYMGSAVADLTARSQEHGYNVAKKKKDLGDNARKISNRQDGIYRATKGMRKEEFMERAVAILGEDFADATFEEIVVALQEARGRPRIHPPKDPNAPKRPRGRPKKGSAPAASTAKPAAKSGEESGDGDKDREHIVMGLRKAVSLRGQHHVKFADGSTHQIPMAHAQRALAKHDDLKRPSEKMTFARKLAASKDSFYKALDDKNPGAEPPKKPKITLAKSAS